MNTKFHNFNCSFRTFPSFTSFARKFFCYLLLTLCCSCGPSLQVFVSSPPQIQTLALLPPTLEAEVSQEDEEIITSLLVFKLREKGYLVIEPRIVFKYCANDASCRSGRSELKKDYSVDALVEFKIDSNYSANFFAGYYNTLSGEIIFKDLWETKIYAVEHQESERGGLIFSSGQVFQGLKDTYQNYLVTPLSRLSQKFIENVVYVLPTPQALTTNRQSKSEILDYELTKIKQTDQSKVCINHHKDGLADLIVGSKSYNLRKVVRKNKKEFKYCSILPIKKLLISTKSRTADLRFTDTVGESVFTELKLNDGQKGE